MIDQVTAGDVDVVSFSELTPEAEARINASELGELLPNQVSTPIGGASGTGLYSRYPMRRLPAPGVEGNDLPTVIASLELPDGGSAEVYSIHPYPPTGEHEVAGLRRYLDAIPPAEPEGPPRLLIGDFNSTLDNAMLRDVLDRGYTDAAAAAGDGLSWTWPQRLYPPPVTIDHVIVDERVEVLEYQTHELPGSDHRMVLAGLRLPGTEQVAPAP